MSFKNKVVIVTGSSSGIGAATAIKFSQEGAKVTVVGRNETKLTNVADTIKETGNDFLVIKADVANDEDANMIVEKTVQTFGQIDVLVNNAATYSELGCLLDGNAIDSYDQIMNTNIRSIVYLTQLCAQHLTKTKGDVVNVSSVRSIGVPKDPNNLIYSVSKAALDHFTRGAALELAKVGVRVNAVNPGPVKTDILYSVGRTGGLDELWDSAKSKTALNRVSNPEEIADLIVYLAGDKAKGITGSCVLADNGMFILGQ